MSKRSRLHVAMFIFDPDCGFCSRYVHFVSSFPAFIQSVRPTPYNEARLRSLGLTEEECQRAAQWVSESGAVSSGSDAIAESLIATRSPLLSIIGHIVGVRLLRPLFHAGYRWVANHRNLLSGGSSTCAVAGAGPTSSL